MKFLEILTEEKDFDSLGDSTVGYFRERADGFLRLWTLPYKQVQDDLERACEILKIWSEGRRGNYGE
ncbi:hypothetical protein HYV88_02825 [Candidatus Woesearchaeota archaeon]|nr:hypothetical protein [Candidatus Woesearchaeota archaeon]